jgi:hypothetical protein
MKMLTLITTLSWVATAPAFAQTATYPPLHDYMMPKDAEVALAKSAAPANISADANALPQGRDFDRPTTYSRTRRCRAWAVHPSHRRLGWLRQSGRESCLRILVSSAIRNREGPCARRADRSRLERARSGHTRARAPGPACRSVPPIRATPYRHSRCRRCAASDSPHRSRS